MNRRRFLQIALGSAAAVVAGLPAQPPPRQPPPVAKSTINPAWLNAPYEATFFFHQDALALLVPLPVETLPARYEFRNGTYQLISHYLHAA